MKRNKFGINVDEGVALTTPEEFERLFVDAQSDAKKRLLEWLRTGDKPISFGGQIGCGKTTLIEYAFHESDIKPDIIFHFDIGSLNLSEIDSWAIVFTELFRYIADNDWIDIDEIPTEYKEILGGARDVWHESISQIRLESFSSASIEKNKIFNSLLESGQDIFLIFLLH